MDVSVPYLHSGPLLPLKPPGLLPPWWTKEKRSACEKLAVDKSQWSDLNCAVEKSDMVEHYGDGFMPMKLRMLAERVYGKGVY